MQLFKKRKPVYNSYQFLNEFKKLKAVIKSCTTIEQWKSASRITHFWVDRVILDKNFVHEDMSMVSSLAIALIRDLTTMRTKITGIELE